MNSPFQMQRLVEQYDWIVVGSGAGSMCAALLMKTAGCNVVILEKTEKIGGSAALSGGVAWIPCNTVMKEAGLKDSFGDAMTYLNACAGSPSRGSTIAQRETYVRSGTEAIDFLRARGMKFESPVHYSDYHEGEYPGAVPGGRALIASMFDLNELGDYASRLRRYPAGQEYPVSVIEANRLSISGRGWASKRAYLNIAWRMLRRKFGSQVVGMGAAFQGRLLKLATDAGIPIFTDTPVEEMLVERGQVIGVIVNDKGVRRSIRSKLGVLLNAGGFARNPQMRKRYQSAPNSAEWTLANPGDTGEMLEEGIRLGADTNNLDLCVWVTVSLPPGVPPAFTLGDMSKPHAIMVDSGGSRYVNEATSYVKVGLTMYERNKVVPAIPSWIIMDSQHRERYFLAGNRAGKIKPEWIEAGFVITAPTISDLEKQCGIPAGALAATVQRYNQFCRAGEDADFHRGRSKWDGFNGDATVHPNGNLGNLAKGPFYAVKAYPGDVGTYGGLVTDENARVLRKDGSIIDGLYAAGNIAAPVTGRAYPGAGASIGPALVFSYVAARHALAQRTKHAAPHDAPIHPSKEELA